MYTQNVIRGSILTTLSAASIGTAFLFSKVAFFELNIRTFLSLWMAFSGFFSAIAYLIRGGNILTGIKKYWFQLIVLGFLNFVTAYTFYAAIQLTPKPSIVAFLARMATIPSMLFSVIILKETVPQIAILGALLLILGSLMLSYVSGPIGWTLILLTIIFSTTETMSLLLGKVLAKKIPALMINLVRCWMISICAILIIPGQFALPSINVWGIVVSGAFLSPFLGYTLYFMALKWVDAWFVAVLICLQPIFVAIYDRLILGNLLTPLQTFSGALILIGALIVSKSVSRNNNSNRVSV